ncbi:hypothetical protein FHS15_005228 [Paenibacillus castaneae]|uniref:hypothetical protein n=1 Tax=Paenibacillus castaneae TaxID=474957 RepID=UPI000C9C4274|nr:hypothetical protein [Paenibacillus castaneae]NIK80044.1 hypothetical protein [Paenibacillus castaneae]
MKRMQWYFAYLSFLIVAGSFIIFPTDAHACSCVQLDTVQEYKDRSDAVFEGTVTAIKSSSMSLLKSTADPVKVSFQVNEVWKGHVKSDMEVLTAEGGDSCAFGFKEGERYLVYARNTGKSLEVNLCSGTMLHSQSAEHVSYLGNGSMPPQADEGIYQADGNVFQYILILSLIIVILSVLFFFYSRRKRINP